MSNINKVFSVINCALPSEKLPTSADIIKAICFEMDDQKIIKKDAIDIITNQVNKLWQRAEIATVSKQRVKAKIGDYFEKYVALCYTHSSRSTFDDKLEPFKVKQFK